MPSTYTPIATAKVTTTTQSITFSSIPQTHTDLVLVWKSANVTTGLGGGIRYNGDSGTNYQTYTLQGNTTPTSGIFSADDVARCGGQQEFGMTIVHIMDYASTNKWKMHIARFGQGLANSVGLFVGYWSSTSAINSVQVTNINYPIGTIVSLYGIKAA
jgi:hypothetical protein